MLSAWLIGEAIKFRVYNATEATWSAGRYMLMKIVSIFFFEFTDLSLFRRHMTYLCDFS